MKKVLAFLLILVAAFSVYWFFIRSKEHRPKPPKQAPITVKKHSDTFNNSIDEMMNDYFALKDAFVEGDTIKIKNSAVTFIKTLDNLVFDELKKDDSMIMSTVWANIDDIKANAESIIKQTDITEMRQDFRTVSDILYPSFFITINYEGPNLYLQNCPMAFDGDKDANWISNSEEVINPYLGKNHPKYKATMLNCGEVKDSIVSK